MLIIYDTHYVADRFMFREQTHAAVQADSIIYALSA